MSLDFLSIRIKSKEAWVRIMNRNCSVNTIMYCSHETRTCFTEQIYKKKVKRLYCHILQNQRKISSFRKKKKLEKNWDMGSSCCVFDDVTCTASTEEARLLANIHHRWSPCGPALRCGPSERCFPSYISFSLLYLHKKNFSKCMIGLIVRAWTILRRKKDNKKTFIQSNDDQKDVAFSP
jgi:hypothetical protein